MLTQVSAGALRRGKPGRATPPDLRVILIRAWLVAFGLKLLGSSWDVSWHFKWLRDDFAPPHLVNSAGTVLAMCLVGLHWYTGHLLDRTSKRFVEGGMYVFMLAVPLDVLNHRVNGLDITSWSPTHAMLYLGTGLMLVGLIRVTSGFTRGVFFAFFLENWHFPALHQEYGVFALKAWHAGHPEAEPSLLAFAARQMGRPVDDAMVQRFAEPVSDWVYPLWTALGAMLVLVVARKYTGMRWTATCVTGAYLLYRAATGLLLQAADFPRSAWPVFLLAGAVAIDLSFRHLPQLPVVGALVTVGAVYAGLVFQDTVWETAPYALDAWIPAAVLLSIGWYAVHRWLPDPTRGS